MRLLLQYIQLYVRNVFKNIRTFFGLGPRSGRVAATIDRLGSSEDSKEVKTESKALALVEEPSPRERILIHALLLQARALGHMTTCKRRDAMDCLECMDMINQSFEGMVAALGRRDILQAFKDLGYTEKDKE